MTADRPPRPVDDALLHALADGRLPPEQADALRAQLGEAEQATAAQWAEQRAQLRGLHTTLQEAPLPNDLRRLAEQLQAQQDQRQQWSRWGRWSGIAAGWVLAFGLGWLVHGQGASSRSPAVVQRAQAVQVFAQQAAVAHAVYQPEQRHAVEVPAEQHAHLVQWLSKRLGRPLTVPVLQPQGFELVGGRLLPGAPSVPGARAQFMYQNAAGVRITLYLGAVDSATPSQETAFSFQTEGAVASFYWVDQGFGYALSGELPRAELLTLATAVHQQL